MIVLDANILMEILEERPRQIAVIEALARYRSEKSPAAALSTLTVSHVLYLAEKHGVPLVRAEALLASYRIFSVEPLDVSWALARYKQNDFEDALQVAAAIREGCTSFMTLDKTLAKKYGRYLTIDLIM